MQADNPRGARLYLRFCLVGAVVAVAALLSLAGLQLLVPQTPTGYAASVAIVYVNGIALSFFLQRRFVFVASPGRQLVRFTRFVVTALFGAILTSAVSSGFRFTVNWPNAINAYSGFLSFIVACLLASAMTFSIYRYWVFASCRE